MYYENTDFSGVVYHAEYLKFLERGRTEFLRERGIIHSSLYKKGETFVVSEINLTFRKAAVMDDELIIKTKLLKNRGAYIELNQIILRDSSELVSALVKVCKINHAGKVLRIISI